MINKDKLIKEIKELAEKYVAENGANHTDKEIQEAEVLAQAWIKFVRELPINEKD